MQAHAPRPLATGREGYARARRCGVNLDTGLPANIDAEKTILGAVLLDNSAHAEAAEKLEAEDFSLDSHRRIFLRMTELMDKQHAVDFVTLANSLQRHKEIEAVGGVA